jgi:enamine deaminase RidA (YjgF/YER057c/UK114 family)
VFVSGIRPGGPSGRQSEFSDLPIEARDREQGFVLADLDEGSVSADSFSAHANLEAVLRAAGSAGDQILRQHIWQRDKRYFPCYERVRVHFQQVPAPSSGLGVSALVGRSRDWIGIDAIAVAPDENPIFSPRAVLSDVYNKDLPSASHYSQAVLSGDLIFTAGHIAIKTAAAGKPLVNGFDDVPEEGRFLATGRSHPDSRDGPIAAQAWYVYAELARLLTGGGLSFKDVVLSTVYLADVRDFAVFHRIHRHFFPDGTAALAVAGFNEVGHRGCRIEIELTASRPDSSLPVARTSWAVPQPFSAPAAVSVGPVIFFSGMVGIGRDGRLVHSAAQLEQDARALVRPLEEVELHRGFSAQCWAAFERLAEAAQGAGSSLSDLVKMTVYLRDPAELPIFESIRESFIPDEALPAFECVAVFGPGPVAAAHVQIEAIGANLA